LNSISDKIINHLGKKPVKGGRPPKDRRRIINLRREIFEVIINFNS
jgi:hypothetical protein